MATATDTSLDYKSMLLTLLNLPDGASDDAIQAAYDSETEEAGSDQENSDEAAAETSPGAEGGSAEGSSNGPPPAAKKYRGSAMQIIIRGHK